MMMKTASIKTRRKAMASSSRLPVRREHGRLEDVKAWWWQTRINIGASRFINLGLKMGGTSGEDRWR